jgi:ABC-type Co2+ transport system permease subunit
MAGNIVLVIIWRVIGSLKSLNPVAARIAALILAAVVKFAVLYVGVVRIAVPFMLSLPEKQAATISNMFTLPQLFTAAIGGAIAVIILPLLEKALKR